MGKGIREHFIILQGSTFLFSSFFLSADEQIVTILDLIFSLLPSELCSYFKGYSSLVIRLLLYHFAPSK